MVGERCFDLRVAELDERTVPQLSRRGLLRERRDLVGVDLAQLAVDLAGTPAACRLPCGRRRHLQLGRMLEDFRHHAVDELVVELDAALLERLLEHVVDERRLRLIARFVPSERDDRRVERLIVQQREERHLQRGSAPSTPAPWPGIPGYSTSPDADAGVDVGRGCAVDDHLRSAVVDVVVGREDGDPRRLEADLKVLRGRARQLSQLEKRLAASPTRRCARRPPAVRERSVCRGAA